MAETTTPGDFFSKIFGIFFCLKSSITLENKEKMKNKQQIKIEAAKHTTQN